MAILKIKLQEEIHVSMHIATLFTSFFMIFVSCYRLSVFARQANLLLVWTVKKKLPPNSEKENTASENFELWIDAALAVLQTLWDRGI